MARSQRTQAPARKTRPAAKTSARSKTGDIERIKRLIRAQGEALLQRPNVTSVGIGMKQVGGKTTNVPALQFTVEQKLAPEALEARAIAPLPESIEFEGRRIPVDILQRSYVPTFKVVQLEAKPARKARQDPVRGGISIGHIRSTAGTLGTIVRDVATAQPLILSNWHVLSGASGAPGDTIVQPGPFDDDRLAQNAVGKLVRSHLGIAGDCAVASIENRQFDTRLLELDIAVANIGKAELGDLAVKSGRTTGVTYATVTRIEALFKMTYEGVGEKAVSGFELEPSPAHPAPDHQISKGGDSGSVWMAVNPKTGKVTDTLLGLHFGGEADGSASDCALACNAYAVFQKLEIAPWTGEPAPQAVARKRPPHDSPLRTGFDSGFLAFAVPRPTFLKRVEADLRGLAGQDSIDYCHFTAWLSASRKLPLCCAWNIDGGAKKSIDRKGLRFVKDERDGLDAFQVGDELYRHNDIDRGHLARRDDLVWGSLEEARQANQDSFFFTNMTPQHRAFNQSKLNGKWGLLENAVLEDVVLHKLRVSLMGGPVLDPDDAAYRGVQLPRQFWKAVFFTDDDDHANKARAFLLTQDDLLKTLKPEALELGEFRWYQVPLGKIETLTGLRFGRALHRIDTLFPERAGEPAILIEGSNFFR
ncbi:DNA/RNA non-specific endonuclease [Caballeronia sp. LZ035]|uniref:DNA/RNA non-specific endonuclease n=1 Tax=Caballeronia sp. LZ035 TaxID=3038568 RepID=UPI00285CB430|nr:DNA/RNA non-specific endonuclease [Caballeronia sp. LZ035]MDR5759270.1 DNA/RNA non-specific endonuclease [Caballeronia sp. LZ035]